MTGHRPGTTRRESRPRPEGRPPPADPPLAAAARQPRPEGVPAPVVLEPARERTSLQRGDLEGAEPSPEPDRARERSLRERSADAAPLLFVAAACFAIGFGLRATASTGPVEAFPIWSLFLALGLVAGVGAGFSFNLGEDEPEAPAQVIRERPAPRGRRPEVSSDPGPAPEGAGPASKGRVRPAGGERDVSPRIPGRFTGSGLGREAAPWDEEAPDQPEWMVAELDRIMTELRPSRGPARRPVV